LPSSVPRIASGCPNHRGIWSAVSYRSSRGTYETQADDPGCHISPAGRPTARRCRPRQCTQPPCRNPNWCRRLSQNTAPEGCSELGVVAGDPQPAAYLPRQRQSPAEDITQPHRAATAIATTGATALRSSRPSVATLTGTPTITVEPLQSITPRWDSPRTGLPNSSRSIPPSGVRAPCNCSCIDRTMRTTTESGRRRPESAS
jgi:hypothetical protein